MPRCPSCGSGNIDTNDAGGIAVCTNCGTVLEENLIVSSVEFTENANGGSAVVGQFVSGTCTTPFTTGGPGYAKESREITINNGRKKIAHVAAALGLGQFFVDSAHRLFLLAVHRNFVQGRKTTHVIAACLYIMCRREKAPHLLIDFSDVLQTNVYTLGSCFLKFARLLNMKLPVIDPSLYIQRFASKLEFGDKTHAVASTALRLVARMKRDWIQTGRRPSGICGAALIIASRMHGFRRTQKEVVKVLHICEETLRLRLLEFEATPSSRLTMEKFLAIDLPREEDPPALIANQRKEMPLLTDGSASEAGTSSSNPRESEKIDEAARAMYDEIEQELLSHEELAAEEVPRLIRDKELPSSIPEDSPFSEEAQAQTQNDNASGNNAAEEIESNKTQCMNPANPSSEPADESRGVDSPDTDDSNHSPDTLTGENTESISGTGDDLNGELDDLDDEDMDDGIEDSLLTEEEIKKKTAIWEELHQSYFEEQARRAEVNSKKKPPVKRKRAGDMQVNERPRTSSMSQRLPHLAAGTDPHGDQHPEVVKQAKMSKKIDYEVLKRLTS